MKTGIIVQMRLDSRRLPRKALLPLGQGTLASAVMSRLRGLRVDEYILACDPDSVGSLNRIAAQCGFSVFAGSREDVLDRYIRAAEHYKLGRLIRATGDNPLVSTELAGQLLAAIDSMESETGIPVDYAGHVGMPLGMGVELVRLSALRRAAAESRDAYEHEHVCPYLYRHPESFCVRLLDCPPGYGLPETRVTIDTPDDYQRLRTVIAVLGTSPSDSELMAYLRAAEEPGTRFAVARGA